MNLEAMRQEAERLSDRLVELQENCPECECAHCHRTWEKQVDAAYAAAQGLEDEIEVIEAAALLADSDFAAHVAASLASPPPGPVELGSATIWHGGREYFADEVIALAAKQGVEAAA